jgi:hypothetical protein
LLFTLAGALGGVRSVNGTLSFFVNGERHDGTYEFDDLVAASNYASTPGWTCNGTALLAARESFDAPAKLLRPRQACRGRVQGHVP